jgi:hypothetical protein
MKNLHHTFTFMLKRIQSVALQTDNSTLRHLIGHSNFLWVVLFTPCASVDFGLLGITGVRFLNWLAGWWGFGSTTTSKIKAMPR